MSHDCVVLRANEIATSPLQGELGRMRKITTMIDYQYAWQLFDREPGIEPDPKNSQSDPRGKKSASITLFILLVDDVLAASA